MEADPDQVGLGTQLSEPVAQGAGGEAALMVAVGREDPLTERGVPDPPAPSLLAGPPQLDGGPAEGEPAGPLGLGGPDLLTGDATLNVQNPANGRIFECARR